MATRTQAPSRHTNRQMNRRAAHTDPYMHGTTAPQLKLQATPRPEHRPGKPAGNQSVRHNHQIRRNQERALYMDLPYAIMLTTALVFTLYLYINYLHV